MNETHDDSARRILVAIDMSPLGAAALETAAHLATELRAELDGLFIEDVNLLRLAGLPFSREIDGLSGAVRPLDPGAMEQALQRGAEGVRQAIANRAQQARLHWTFRISRGSLARTMLAESAEVDLFLVGREPMSPGFLLRTSQHRGPIMLIDDGGEASDRLFKTAQRLARQHADALVALVRREHVPADTRLASKDSPVYWQQCPEGVDDLLRAVQRWRPQLLLLDRASPLVSEATINALVMQLSCPLLLVQ